VALNIKTANVGKRTYYTAVRRLSVSLLPSNIAFFSVDLYEFSSFTSDFCEFAQTLKKLHSKISVRSNLTDCKYAECNGRFVKM